MEANTYDEKYIEHEVKLRVLKEMEASRYSEMNSKFFSMQKNFDDKFALMQKNIDDRFSHVDYKINIIIGIGIAALLVPLIKSMAGVL
jgi:hypothetical protein